MIQGLIRFFSSSFEVLGTVLMQDHFFPKLVQFVDETTIHRRERTILTDLQKDFYQHPDNYTCITQVSIHRFIRDQRLESYRLEERNMLSLYDLIMRSTTFAKI